MNRIEALEDVREHLGEVPDFLWVLPDAKLEYEWRALKDVLSNSADIHTKYEELVDLAMSFVSGCRYHAHSIADAANFNGTTDAEIRQAMRLATLIAACCNSPESYRQEEELVRVH